MSFREIRTPSDEQHLLTEIIRLNTEFRKKKERDRLLSLKRNTEYEQIFNPITKTMQSLLAPQAAAGDAPITAEQTLTPLNHHPPNPLLPASAEQIQQPKRRSRGRSSKRGSKRVFREAEEGLKEERQDFDMPPQSSKSSNSVYRHVLDQIKPQHREKGELGLRSDGTIAGHHYEINGDVLTVHTSPTTPPQSFTIHDPDVWRLLLLHNVPAGAIATKSQKSAKVPATTTTKKSGKKGTTTTTTTPQINPTSLESYREIILKILDDGNLSTAAAPGPGGRQQNSSSSSLNLRQRLVNKNRPKFKLLISGKGLSKIGGGRGDGSSGKQQQQQQQQRVEKRRNGKKGGFLFSTEGPRRRRSDTTSTTTGTGFETATTRTIVIPRTNRGLLRELTLSLSELRAGNEGERETCIQLSREARRRGILPRHLLSQEEMLWSSYK